MKTKIGRMLLVMSICFLNLFIIYLNINNCTANSAEDFGFNELAALSFSNVAENRVLGVNSYEYNAQVKIHENANLIQNEWFLEFTQNGYKIKNIYASKLMTSDGNKVFVTGENESGENGIWLLSKISGNLYKIIHKKSGKSLAVKNHEPALSVYSDTPEFHWVIVQINPDYEVPIPNQVKTGTKLLGMNACNLWDIDTRPTCWDNIEPYPDRKPFLGFYKEGSIVSVDWEIKALVESGINFISLCWYRDKANEGKSPVTPLYDHWIKGLKQARYKDLLKYVIMFTNNDHNLYSNFQDEADLLNNLMPFWINNYFKDTNYLKINNKPVFIIYNDSKFIEKLGGVDKAAKTIEKMRKMTRDSGFNDLIIIGQFCWGNVEENHKDMKSMGFDAVTAYHVPTFGTGAVQNKLNYTGQEMIVGHTVYWNKQQASSLIPYIPTVSMGWDSSPWNGSSSKKKWRYTPNEFKTTTENALKFLELRKLNNETNNILFFDNWNEFGEGHYIMPTEQYGFGYLEAIKQVFGETEEIVLPQVSEDFPTSSYNKSSVISEISSSFSSEEEQVLSDNKSETDNSNISAVSSENNEYNASGKSNILYIILIIMIVTISGGVLVIMAFKNKLKR